jgi:hypothetical protein
MTEVKVQTNKVHVNKIDDILVGITPKTPEFAEEPKEIEAIEPEQESQELEVSEPEEKEEIKEPEPKKEIEQKSDKEESHLDEYGNETEKPRLYTDEDVQRMIKERLQRGQSQVQPEVQQAADNFQADPNNPEDWEVQLEKFIEKTTQKLEQKKQTKAWQDQERQKQQDFEVKFTHGMNKYRDFKETVGQMPITDSIMMATRDMNDPAAFLYAASKLHPEEVKRIANMPDPFAQAREIGKLDERMRKTRAISKAPAPLAQNKGDMSPKYVPKLSIDQKILSHAKMKNKR